jgi:3-oxoacyl-[acyl-carrier-protein] synthase-3
LVTLINNDEQEAFSSGIQTLHTCESGISSTALSVKAFQKLADKENTLPTDIDCVAWIAEGVDDFIYMDTAKTFIEDIKGNTDGEVHTYQLYGGAGGTLQAIQLISNQVLANPTVNKALIVSSLIWESHSHNRLLQPTFLGDGAGVILIEANGAEKMILGIKTATLEAGNTSFAIPYGGTKHPITQEVINKEAFKVNTISQKGYDHILDNIIKEASKMIAELCENTKVDITKIDCIGISGFHKKYTEELLKMLPEKQVIDPLLSKGYLGSMGVFEVLDQFLNNSLIAKGSIILIINLGLEGNLESAFFVKP